MSKVLLYPKPIITSACVVLLALGIWLMLRSNAKVLILDPRFQVLTVNWSSGTNHVLYEGNQLEGQLRHWLSGMGLRVKGIPASHFHTDKDSRGLLIRYSGRFLHGELNDVTAELAGPGDQTMPLRAIVRSEDTTKKEFVGVWVVNSVVTNSGSELRIKLRTTSVDLAEIIGNRL